MTVLLEHKVWYDNGQIKLHYFANKMNKQYVGKYTKWHKNGNLDIVKWYDETTNQVYGVTEVYYENGQQALWYDRQTGEVIEWYENGVKSRHSWYNVEDSVEIFCRWYATGLWKEHSIYTLSTANGELKYWEPYDTKPSTHEFYNNGKNITHLVKRVCNIKNLTLDDYKLIYEKFHIHCLGEYESP